MSKTSPLSGNELTLFLKTRDHLHTGEPFELYYDKEWDMLITFPCPENPEKYYETEEYKPHRSTVQSLFDVAYKFVRNIGFSKKKKLIRTFAPQAKKVLDYGCATGEFVLYMSRNGYLAEGLEPHQKTRNAAEKLLNKKVYSSLEEVQDKFDVITLWHVLEHIPDLKETLENFRNILSEKGTLFIAVPNFKSYDANHYKEFWAAYDVPRHLWHFSPTAIRKLFAKFGMELLKTEPLIFDAYYVSLLSEKYKTGKKNIFKALRTGGKSNSEAKKTGNYSSLIYVLRKR